MHLRRRIGEFKSCSFKLRIMSSEILSILKEELIAEELIGNLLIEKTFFLFFKRTYQSYLDGMPFLKILIYVDGSNQVKIFLRDEILRDEIEYNYPEQLREPIREHYRMWQSIKNRA